MHYGSRVRMVNRPISLSVSHLKKILLNKYFPMNELAQCVLVIVLIIQYTIPVGLYFPLLLRDLTSSCSVILFFYLAFIQIGQRQYSYLGIFRSQSEQCAIYSSDQKLVLFCCMVISLELLRGKKATLTRMGSEISLG